MPLIITVGAANANSYADKAFATACFDPTLRAARWQAVVNTARDEAALFEAMKFIEAVQLAGLRVNETQALEFPRYGGPVDPLRTRVPSDKLRDLNGRLWGTDVIPEPVKQAQCEQALALVENDLWLDRKHKSMAINSGGLEAQFKVDGELGPLCDEALRLLEPFMLYRFRAVR